MKNHFDVYSQSIILTDWDGYSLPVDQLENLKDATLRPFVNRIIIDVKKKKYDEIRLAMLVGYVWGIVHPNIDIMVLASEPFYIDIPLPIEIKVEKDD